MNDLNEFLMAVIVECTAIGNRGRIIFNGTSFYCESPRLGKKFDISNEDIQLLVDQGYADRLWSGAIKLNAKKMDEIYYDLFVIEKIPHPKHERMTLDVIKYNYLLH